jgi:hypothetical protein
MRKKSLWLPVLILVVDLKGTYATGEKARGTSVPRVTFFKSLELDSIRRIPMESKGKPIVELKHSGKEKKILVELVQRSYHFRGMKIVSGVVTPFEPSGSLFCYEIRSKDEKELFAWSFWSTTACGCFSLFSDQKKETYLAFVECRDVFLARVDAHRDSASELTDFVMNGWRWPIHFIRVPVSDLIPRDEFRGINALYEDDIKIESVSIFGREISLGLSSRGTEKKFLLEYDGEKWERK